MIPEYLRAGTAGACVTHLPEVVFIQAREAIWVNANLINPNIRRFIITNMNRYPKSIFWKFQYRSQELPGIANSLTLKIITKTKVTQHFKESVMPCGITDVFKIIMFAARTHTTLR